MHISYDTTSMPHIHTPPLEHFAIADTGSSGHYFNPSTYCLNKHPNSAGPTITLPNGELLHPTHSSHLAFPPTFTPQSTMAHIYPSLQHPLISIGQLCDDDKIAIFTKSNCYILHATDIQTIPNLANKSLVTGIRDPNTKLWNINTNQTTGQQLSNNVYHHRKLQDIITFHHQSLFSPVKSTWLKAISNGNFSSWPSLTEANVQKYLQPSTSTSKGHIKQIRQHIRSTKASPNKHNVDMTETRINPSNSRTNLVFAKPINLTGLICSDQTGRFPVTSNRGNKYIMVILDYDSNAIITRPLPSRSQTHLLQAFASVNNYLISIGRQPKFVRIDNEAPTILRQYMTTSNIKYQIVPPHNHRRNYAEKAINSFKDHFIAGLTNLNKSFPLKLWCRLLPHAEDSLNLLRQSRIHPHLSSYADLNGAFDYNATTLLPPGTKLIIHEKRQQRASWDPRGVDGWYLGPAKNHYRCHRVYCSRTNSERITDTVHIFPHAANPPTVTTQEAAILTTEALTDALTNPKNLKHFGSKQIAALHDLAKSLAHASSGQHKPTFPLLPHAIPAHPPNPIPEPRVHTPLQPHRIPEPRVDNPVQRQTTPPCTSHPYNLRPLPHRSTQAIIQTTPRALTNAIYDADSGSMLEYKQLLQKDPKTWNTSMANEIGRLAQGIGNRIKGTNTINFIHKRDIPSHKTVTYSRIVADYRPHKSEPFRTRLTVGGNLLHCNENTKTDCASLPTIKTFFNSVISTPGARFATGDIKNFYLEDNPLQEPEFMRIHISLLPPEAIEEYNLNNFVDSQGYVYIQINKGMYGLKQAGAIAHYNLKLRLSKHGYHPCKFTKGLWSHNSNSIKFMLVVDDFGIRYKNEKDLQHLFTSLREKYTISVDITGKNFCGFTLDWNYTNKFVDISMPSYIKNLLQQLNIEKTQPEHAPHRYNIPAYGQKIQLAPDEDTSPKLTQKEKQRIQQIVGSLLYYGRAVDPTILVALGSIASQQNQPTKTTAESVTKLLNYVATYPNAIIRYNKSDMILHVHSDASYLSEPKARSRAGGHFYLSNSTTPFPNGPVHTISSIMRNVMSSAAEAEIGAIFINCQDSEPIRNALLELGHAQPPTPVQTDNSTANGFLNETIKQKRTKAIDMRFYWVIDRIKQNHFRIFWKPGSENLADYFTKHHSPTHHKRMRPFFIHSKT